MKVKYNEACGPIYDVLEESSRYYIGRQIGLVSLEVLPKAEYSPLPEPRWEDVTAACEAMQDDINHRRPDGLYAVRHPTYRLRKVELPEGRIMNGKQYEAYAFLVERKVE